MTDIAIAVGLVLIPLALRWFTAWQMGRYRKVVLSGDETCKKLAGELHELRAAIDETKRRQRQYASHRSHLRGQIEEARAALAELRRPVRNRIAA